MDIARPEAAVLNRHAPSIVKASRSLRIHEPTCGRSKWRAQKIHRHDHRRIGTVHCSRHAVVRNHAGRAITTIHDYAHCRWPQPHAKRIGSRRSGCRTLLDSWLLNTQSCAAKVTASVDAIYALASAGAPRLRFSKLPVRISPAPRTVKASRRPE